MTLKFIVDQTSPQHSRVRVYAGGGETLAHCGDLTFNKYEWSRVAQLLQIGQENDPRYTKLTITEVH